YETSEKEDKARFYAAERERRAQEARFSRLKTGAIFLSGILVLLAVTSAWYAIKQRERAIAELQRYNEATGRGFWINLEFTTPNLTPSEVDALWQVATATPVARAAFIQKMLSDPAVLVRFGRRP